MIRPAAYDTLPAASKAEKPMTYVPGNASSETTSSPPALFRGVREQGSPAERPRAGRPRVTSFVTGPFRFRVER